ncbi:hypothetical protein E3N88_21547 [Mikania micrantha]|uniref:Uncharacterized protein n=1 Tax=Mikania micrantha TaxID=192012 RepID=A0A5N6NKJ3_9ASTR|nr:hypothetical protein E3N88_21547 [Mikania micrantha]
MGKSNKLRETNVEEREPPDSGVKGRFWNNNKEDDDFDSEDDRERNHMGKGSKDYGLGSKNTRMKKGVDNRKKPKDASYYLLRSQDKENVPATINSPNRQANTKEEEVEKIQQTRVMNTDSEMATMHGVHEKVSDDRKDVITCQIKRIPHELSIGSLHGTLNTNEQVSEHGDTGLQHATDEVHSSEKEDLGKRNMEKEMHQDNQNAKRKTIEPVPLEIIRQDREEYTHEGNTSTKKMKLLMEKELDSSQQTGETRKKLYKI